MIPHQCFVVFLFVAVMPIWPSISQNRRNTWKRSATGNGAQLSDGSRKRIKPGSMSESEVMTIVIYFHLMRYRDFKHYYLFHVCRNMRSYFPHLVSYNRFVELMQSTLLPMVVFLKVQRLGKCTGISFIDSTPLRACHIKREF